jgi:hypothetical protein
MLYVLATDSGGLYYYRPGDTPGSHSVGKTGHDWAAGGAVAQRPAGSYVIVFERPADAYQVGSQWGRPGEGVEPRPAREMDDLGDTVCFASREGGKPGDIVFALRPTPPDALKRSENASS